MYGYYSNPASYYQRQNQQFTSNMMSLLNALAQIKGMKQEKDWREEVVRPYYEARTKNLNRPPQPKPLTEDQVKRAAVLNDPNLSVGDKKYFLQHGELPEPKKELPPVHPKFEAWLTNHYGESWRETMPYDDFKDIRNYWQSGPGAYKSPKEKSDKYQAIEHLVETEKITREEGDMLHADISLSKQTDYSGPKGAPSRDANERRVKGILDSMDEEYRKNPKKYLENSPSGTRPIVGGVYLDMPYEYNVAIRNKADGIQTVEDEKNIKKFDALFRYFQDITDPYSADQKGMQYAKNFKDWLRLKVKTRDPQDRMWIKKWYDIYK